MLSHHGLKTTVSISLMLLLLFASVCSYNGKSKFQGTIQSVDNWVMYGAIPFSPLTHKDIQNALLNNECSRIIDEATQRQDWNQFQSKLHFDNCAFQDGIEYLQSKEKELQKEIDLFKKIKSTSNDKDLLKKFRHDSFHIIGGMLHTLQDFYAHSNYVELMLIEYPVYNNMPIVRLWDKDAEKNILLLVDKGLYSGTFFLDFPKRCKDGTPSHGELNKDSRDPGKSKSGSKVIDKTKNITQYDIAYTLARITSFEFLHYLFDKYPELQQSEMNGNHPLVFQVILDESSILNRLK